MPKQPTISVVDDDESVREATVDLLSSLGFAAEAFQDAEDFLKSNSRCVTSCLIADIQMPRVSGLELYRLLVASGNPIPAVLITAYPNDKIRAQVLRAGVIGYLTKPFSDTKLLDCINTALELRKAS